MRTTAKSERLEIRKEDKSMVKYVFKRLGYILVTLWIIITCTFFLMKNLPGTPFDAERFSIMTPAQQEKVLEMYGLNDPVPVQYVKYIGKHASWGSGNFIHICKSGCCKSNRKPSRTVSTDRSFRQFSSVWPSV